MNTSLRKLSLEDLNDWETSIVEKLPDEDLLEVAVGFVSINKYNPNPEVTDEILEKISMINNELHFRELHKFTGLFDVQR